VTDSAVAPASERPRDRPPVESRQLAGLLLGVGGAGGVTLVAFASVSSTVPALLYMVAIACATIVGGLLPGFATVAASFVGYVYFFASPRQSFSIQTGESLVALLIFTAIALGLSVVIARERRLRAKAQEATLQTRRLEAVASALLKARTPREVLEIVMTEGVYAAEARAGVIGLVTPDGTELEIVAHRGYPEGRMDDWQRFPVDGPLPMSEAVRTGEPIFLATTAERDRRFPAFGYLREDSHALACLPLRFEDRVIGGLALTFPTDQEFPPERRALKEALAAQAANALERARLDAAEREARERLLFLSQASAALTSSLDYGETLRRLAELVVPGIADWCVIDMVADDGSIERVAIAHRDPDKVRFGWEFTARYPTRTDAPRGVAHVIRSREPQFTPEIGEEMLVASAGGDEDWLRIMRELGLGSSITVPLVARDEVLGALSLLRTESRRFTDADLDLALELARRAAVAVDNARLYDEVERRADAARALRHVAEAVVLVDEDGTPRYWNEAAAELFGGSGGPVAQWQVVAEALREHERPESAPVTLPVELGGQERWLQLSSVEFDEGCVYAAHDVTQERRLERTRSEFVATASHELRTPIATVYGTFQTLLREDVTLAPEQERAFLQMGLHESERLTRVVDDLLLAGQLEGGSPRIEPTRCDLDGLVRELVETTAARVNGTHALGAAVDERVRSIQCDPMRLRQVLANLVENAIKYSPGGPITVSAAGDGRSVRIEVADSGIGIPERDQQRIFERFVRLDPALSRGVGGTGLGLYICRELVERMGGRITVRSREGVGSTFTVELPAAPKA
jgi:signal transduction histidine kinase